MAQELELEWWRPQTAQEAPLRETAVDTDQAAVPFWSVMAFTGVLLFSPQAYVPALAPLRPALLIILVGVLSYVSDRWARGLPIFEWNRESGLIAGLGLLAALTVPFSIWPGGSLGVLFDYAKTATIFFLLSHVVTTLSRLRLAAWLLTWMAIGLGLFALYNSLTGAVIDQGANQDRLVGNEGALTKNPNDLALMVNLLLPLSVGLFFASKEAWQRVFLLAAIGMEGVTVVLTDGQARLLHEVATIMTHEAKRVWLVSLNHDEKGTVTLTGGALDHEDISEFQLALERREEFGKVVLKRVTTAKTNKDTPPHLTWELTAVWTFKGTG